LKSDFSLVILEDWVRYTPFERSSVCAQDLEEVEDQDVDMTTTDEELERKKAKLLSQLLGK
jgi:hypothetical protein